MLVGDLERGLDSGGAVVGVENAGVSREARFSQQALGELNGGFVGGTGELHMVEPQNLIGDGLCQFRTSVAVEVHPP